MTPSTIFLALALSAGAAPDTVSGWPQWRGPNRDGVSTETGLLQEWPEDGPKKDWSVKGCGGGYSTVAVVGGFIYGSGRKGDEETIWCRKEATGEEVWNKSFSQAKKVGYDEGTRSTPTVAGDKLYCVSSGGDLVCLKTKDGEKVWSKSYTKDFEGKIQSWGYSESVLVDGDKVICTPCSNRHALVALKADNGDVIWSCEVKSAGGAGGYSSATKMSVGKTDMYVTLLGQRGGVVGVDAKTGKLLWSYNKIMNGTANISTPVVKGDLVWCSTGYNDGGSALLRIKDDGGSFTVEELKYYTSKEMQNHHGGMVLVGDHVFLGHGHNNGFPACVEMKTGKILWKQAKGAAGGTRSGCVVYADGMLYYRYESGKMALVKANPEKYEEAGSFEIPDKTSKPSWSHPVVANGKLYIRDQDNLHCFNVKK